MKNEQFIESYSTHLVNLYKNRQDEYASIHIGPLPRGDFDCELNAEPRVQESKYDLSFLVLAQRLVDKVVYLEIVLH